MAYDYKPDRWRDKSIVAQNAAKVAAEILSGVPDVTEDLFIKWQSVIFQNTMDLVGEPSDPQVEEPSQQSNSSRSSSRSGDAPYGKTEVKFGKFKGMTIAEIDAAVDDKGKSGREWLEWAVDSLDNDFMKKAIRGYLEATK